MFTYLRTCRACGNDKLVKVFSLGVQPLANSFRTLDEEQDGLVPLEVLRCSDCGLAQLSCTVSPEILYNNYSYITSRSQTMQEHFESLWQAIKLECSPESVLEIGSNDSYLLQFFREHGVASVLGIDPAENLMPNHAQTGITSICSVFDSVSAAIAHTTMPVVDVVVARHVFAHVDDWRGFVQNLEVLANKNTLVVLEMPYVMDTLERVELDQIYHEHLSYVSIKAIDALLDNTQFRMQKVMRFPVHGGSIAIFIRRRNCGVAPDESVERFMKAEAITEKSWLDFVAEAHRKIETLKRFVAWEVYSEGKTVCGYGASAKSTVWISACGFTKKEIAFIVDNTPQKQGKCSPGTDIPILPESALTNKSADVAICFSWNYMAEIIAKNQAWKGVMVNPHSL